jgi:competence protein ComEC
MFRRVAASPSKTFLATACAFVAGVALHAVSERQWGAAPFAVASCAALVGVIATWRVPHVRLVFLVAAFVCAGVARYDYALAVLPAPAALEGGERQFSGVLAGEARIGAEGTVLLMDRVFVTDDGREKPLGMRMEVRTRLPMDARPGDRFRWACRPEPVDATRYASAVFLRHVGWRCRPHVVPVRDAAEGGGVRRAMASAKARLRATVGELVPEPSSSLLLGLLVGDKDGLPRDTADAFRRTGTAHVLAVSGYNVSRVVGVIVILFACVGLAKRRASAGVAACVIIFAVFVGAEASVTRAAVMGCSGILATSFGRRYHGPNAFMLAASLMLAFQPLLLRHDAGFRLSFAAVAGLQAFGPPLARRFRFVPDVAGIRSSVAETIGATLATMPLVLRDFGILPVLGVLTNVIIAPLVPLAMAAGAVTLVFSPLVPLALLPAYAATALLRLIVAVVSFAERTFPVLDARVGVPGMALLYAWLFLLWYGFRRVDALCEEKA